MYPDRKEIDSFEQQQLDRLMDEGGLDPEMMKNQRHAVHAVLDDPDAKRDGHALTRDDEEIKDN